MSKNLNKNNARKKTLDLTTRRCLIYARVSTSKDQECSNQISQLQEYAEKQSWEIVEVIEDVCSGGISANERSGLKRVFQMGHRKECDILLFWSMDRLSREGSRKTIQYLTTLDDYGISWHSYTEEYLSSMGIFSDCIISLLSALANQEKIRISERTKAGLARKKKENPHLKLGRKPTDPAKIKKAKQLRAEGLSFAEIGKKMGLTRSRAHQLVRMEG